MFDDYGFEIFETNEFPIAYLLTFRTYGTWLHGDERFAVGRNDMNRYGAPKFQPSVPFVDSMKESQHRPELIFGDAERILVSTAIAEVCEHRDYGLRAMNVRTNHAHVVVSAVVKPEKLVNEFKAYSTRRLRREGAIRLNEKVWSRGSSTRYLWKPKHVEAAIDYVLYCQDYIPFEFKDDS